MAKMIRFTVAILAVTTLAAPAAWAADKDKKDADDKKAPAASPATTGAPSQFEGEVVSVNPDAGTMTVRFPDGSVQEFKGSRETLKDYKPGDKIQGKMRPAR